MYMSDDFDFFVKKQIDEIAKLLRGIGVEKIFFITLAIGETV